MILSNVSIHDAMDKGWLKIDPEPAPRFRQDGGPKCEFRSAMPVSSKAKPSLAGGKPRADSISLAADCRQSV